MTRLLQPLFALVTGATDAKLAQMVEYLKEENRILHAKLPTRITLTDGEKGRLIKLGSVLGSALQNLIAIVSYRTFTRWVAGESKADPKQPASTRKPGRPKTAEDIRTLVVKLATDNGWGYTRVLGELKKLGINTVSRSTVVNILTESGLEPGPKRGKGTWSDFVTRHASTLWASDFVSVRTLTATGFVDLYPVFFIHVKSRKVIVSAPTANPDSAWVAQQARNATMQIAEWNLSVIHLLIDHDTKYTDSFDAVFEADGAKVQRVGPKAPNMNAYAERWVQSLRTECLDHFVVVGERHR